MKRFKKLGILLGVLVVACIATFALTHYEEKQEEIKNSDAIILEIPTDSVTSLSWEYAEEGSLAFHKGENGWLYDEDEYFPVDEEKVTDILSEFEAFGVSFIIENVEDYSQYGLDEPEMTFHIGTEEIYFYKDQKGGLKTRPSDYRKSFAEFAAVAANPFKSFLAAACTWTKIHLRLQVCELCAISAQGVRAADCKKLAKKTEGLFRQAQGRVENPPFLFISAFPATYHP